MELSFTITTNAKELEKKINKLKKLLKEINAFEIKPIKVSKKDIDNMQVLDRKSITDSTI